MNKLKVLELFGGIGACSKALERLGIDYEIADYVEIDKYAVKSFNAMHGTDFEPQDICEWDKDIEADLIMHGSPCQDFSLAGKQAGGDEGSGTRSSLMYETVRIVEKLKPKYVIWENVKNVISKKHKHNYDNYCNKMSELGYISYGKVLNAKDYGIPQNRERVFTISIKKDLEKPFEFPLKQELKLKLKDMLEDNVDEKYYLSDFAIDKIKKHKNKIIENENPNESSTIHAGYYKMGGRDQQYIKTKNSVEVVRKYGVFDNEEAKHQAGSVYDKEGLSPTLDTMQGGWRQPCIEINNGTKKGYDEATDGDSVNLSYPTSKTRRGRVGKQVSQTLQCNDSMGVVLKHKNKRLEKIIEKTDFQEGKVLNLDLYNQTTNENISQCLTEPHHNSQRLYDGLRIRKLTPKECWRLMGFDDEDFEKAEKVNSNTQLYKQAGNSIVVNVLEEILKELL